MKKILISVLCCLFLGCIIVYSEENINPPVERAAVYYATHPDYGEEEDVNSSYKEKPDLNQFYTKEDTNDDIDLIDFTQLTFLECQFDVTFDLLDAANRTASTFTRPFRMFIYLDTLRNQIYNENREAVNIQAFNDEKLIFSTRDYNAKDKKTTERNYEIDRYTGRIFVTGTVRHDYGRWAGFVYKNANLSGNGFCVKNLSGQKF